MITHSARCYINWSLSNPEVLRFLRGTGSLGDKRFVVTSVTEFTGAGGSAVVVTEDLNAGCAAVAIVLVVAGLSVLCNCHAPLSNKNNP